MKGIIFDLDGTLLDTIDDIADSMNEVLSRFNLPLHTVEEYKMYVGDGVTQLVQRSIADVKDAEHMLSALETAYRAEYLKRQADKTVPYEGIHELLSSLVRRGIKISVFSNKPHNATLAVMERYFPEIVFDAVIGQRSGYPIKPDPSGAFEIMNTLGLTADEILYVGDTGTDMQTGKSAGLKTVGALWGFRKEAELVENGADVLAGCPMDILNYI